MARSTDYFHPVKNLLSVDETQHIVNTWNDKNLAQFWCNFMARAFRDGIDNGDSSYLNYLKNFGVDMKDDHLIEAWKAYNGETETSPFVFYNTMNSPEVFEAIGNDLIEKIVERYGADEVCFIYGRDVSQPYHIHKDPDYVRSCNINIPLFPNYDQYRSTYFYKSKEKSSKVYEVDYNKIQTPVLLNNKKWHNCGGSPNYKGNSLALQLGYYRRYPEVRAELSQKGLLSTPV